MTRWRLVVSFLLSVSLVLFQVPLQAFALTNSSAVVDLTDVTGPEISGLRVNGTAVPADGAVTVTNAAWQQAGKNVRVTGTVKDPAGIKSLTLTIAPPTEEAPRTVNPSVNWAGNFTTIQRLAVTGVWTVTVTSVDRAGNVSTLAFAIEVLPDTEGPALSLSALNGRSLPADGNVTLTPATWVNNKAPELKGRVTDVSGVESLSVTATAPDGATSHADITFGIYGTFTYRLNLATAGLWSLAFQAQDRAGNTTTKTLTVNIAEDEAGPVFSGVKVNKVDVPESGSLTVGNTDWQLAGKRVAVSGIVLDAGVGLSSASVTVTSPENVEGAPTALRVGTGGTFTATLSLTAVGIWTVTLDAEDKVGNLTTSSFTVDVKPDVSGPTLTLSTLGGRSVPPELTVNLTTARWFANKTPELRGRVTDVSGIDKLSVTVTAPDSTTATADITLGTAGYFAYKLNLTKAGTWSYVFTATDKAGNSTSTTLVVTVEDDQQGPVLNLKLNGTEVAADATVTLTQADWTAGGKKAYISGLVTDAGAGVGSLSYSVTKPDGTSTSYRLYPITGRFGFYVPLPVTGSWTVTLTATDRLNNATTSAVSIVVEQ